MNKTITIGRLTSNPELRTSQNGSTSCRFTVAVDRNMGKDREKSTDFISCTAFGKNGEFVSKYFTKGSWIGVEGSLRTGSYKDKNHEDVTHYTTEVWVDKVEFVGNKGDGGQQTQTAPAKVETTPTTSTEPVESANSEDIPF